MAKNINRFLVESPRWLLSKGHEKKAYKAVFGKNPSIEYDLGPEKLQISKEEKFKLRFSERIKEYFKEFTRYTISACTTVNNFKINVLQCKL